jgi:hypothetical protein
MSVRIVSEKVHQIVKVEPERKENLQVRLLRQNVCFDWLGISQLTDADPVASVDVADGI